MRWPSGFGWTTSTRTSRKVVGRVAVEEVDGREARPFGRFPHRAVKLAVRVALEAVRRTSGRRRRRPGCRGTRAGCAARSTCPAAPPVCWLTASLVERAAQRVAGPDVGAAGLELGEAVLDPGEKHASGPAAPREAAGPGAGPLRAVLDEAVARRRRGPRGRSGRRPRTTRSGENASAFVRSVSISCSRL